MRCIIVTVGMLLFLCDLSIAGRFKGSVILTEFTEKTISAGSDWKQFQNVVIDSNTIGTKAKSIQGIISFVDTTHEHQLPYFQIINSTDGGIALEHIELIYRGDSEPQIRIIRKMTNHTGVDITFENMAECKFYWEIRWK